MQPPPAYNPNPAFSQPIRIRVGSRCSPTPTRSPSCRPAGRTRASPGHRPCPPGRSRSATCSTTSAGARRRIGRRPPAGCRRPTPADCRESTRRWISDHSTRRRLRAMWPAGRDRSIAAGPSGGRRSRRSRRPSAGRGPGPPGVRQGSLPLLHARGIEPPRGPGEIPLHVVAADRARRRPGRPEGLRGRRIAGRPVAGWQRARELPGHVREVATRESPYPMVRLAACTGARRSELCRSRVGDWRLDETVVKIRGHGSRSPADFSVPAQSSSSDSGRIRASDGHGRRDRGTSRGPPRRPSRPGRRSSRSPRPGVGDVGTAIGFFLAMVRLAMLRSVAQGTIARHGPTRWRGEPSGTPSGAAASGWSTPAGRPGAPGRPSRARGSTPRRIVTATRFCRGSIEAGRGSRGRLKPDEIRDVWPGRAPPKRE